MAQETMVNGSREFAESVRDFVTKLNSAKGPLYFAALAQLESQTPGHWVFLVGSDRLFKNIYDETKNLIEFMGQHLSGEYRNRISKVGIIGPNDPFFRAMANAVRTEQQPQLVHFEDSRINDLYVKNAWIFLSAPSAVAGRAPQKRPAPPAKPVRQRRR